MTIHKALYPRDDVDRLYVSRKEGGRGLAPIQDRFDASIQRLEDSIKKRRGRLITATRNNIDNTNVNNKNNQKKIGRKTTVRTVQVKNKRNHTREEKVTLRRKLNLFE